MRRHAPRGDQQQADQTLVLSDYIEAALAGAGYEEVGDGTVAGEVPSCVGVVAYAHSRTACERELRSVLEGWVLLGLQLGHRLAVLGGVDLNPPPVVEARRAS